MNDNKLLDLAAKSVGFELIDCTCKQERKNSVTGKHWNPLTSDGDALHLAVNLGLLGSPLLQLDWIEARGDTDPYTATRRVIVRAAAEIGKAMP